MKIAIIGAGPAGIEAALAASKAGAQVTVFSRENVLPYARPMLPAVAFSNGDVTPYAIHPAEWYTEHGIDLRLDTPVTGLDVENRIVKTLDGEELFDAFVLAGGANPLKPIIPGLMASPSIYTLWSADDARRLNRHCRRGRLVAVIGGGILGVETALNAARARKKVILIEKSARLLESRLDKPASDAVRKVLEGKGVTVLTGTTVVSAAQIASKLCLRLENAEKTLDVDMVVLTVGAKANLSLAQSAGLAVDRGICVDETLQTSAPNVYAAGDCAQFGIGGHCCVASAVDQGRVAGYNAVAAVNDTEPIFCKIRTYPLHSSDPDLPIHAWGQTAERSINAKAVRIAANKKVAGTTRLKVVRSDGVVVGVQMVGTDFGFDALLPSD